MEKGIKTLFSKEKKIQITKMIIMQLKTYSFVKIKNKYEYFKNI